MNESGAGTSKLCPTAGLNHAPGLGWVSYPRTFGSHSVDYGYLWWLLPVDNTVPSQGDDADVYSAAGARDQWIFVIPKYDMVVVVTGNTSATFAQPVDFLYTDILRAVEELAWVRTLPACPSPKARAGHTDASSVCIRKAARWKRAYPGGWPITCLSLHQKPACRRRTSSIRG